MKGQTTKTVITKQQPADTPSRIQKNMQWRLRRQKTAEMDQLNEEIKLLKSQVSTSSIPNISEEDDSTEEGVLRVSSTLWKALTPQSCKKAKIQIIITSEEHPRGFNRSVREEPVSTFQTKSLIAEECQLLRWK